ncbi:MAG: hypothetical protein RIQ50_1281 [Bacteroidota bacterium]
MKENEEKKQEKLPWVQPTLVQLSVRYTHNDPCAADPTKIFVGNDGQAPTGPGDGIVNCASS